MKKLLLLAMLIVGCDNSTEPQNHAGQFSSIYGDWVTTPAFTYYSINENEIKLINGSSCSGIVDDYNIVEFSDSCLNTNLAIETEIYSYSFKLSEYDENILYTNIVQINLESIQSILDLDNCQMVDTLTKVNEIVNVIDGTPCSN